MSRTVTLSKEQVGCIADLIEMNIEMNFDVVNEDEYSMKAVKDMIGMLSIIGKDREAGLWIDALLKSKEK